MKKSIFVLLVFIAFIFYFNLFPKGNNVGVSMRRSAPEEIIILDSTVPLSDKIVSDETRYMFNQINEYRKANGAKELIWSDDLYDCAVIRAKECKQKWSHTRPNGQDWYTVNKSIMYGENLAKGIEYDEVVQAWKESPAHNDNLLYPDFKYISISMIDGYAACEFCY